MTLPNAVTGCLLAILVALPACAREDEAPPEIAPPAAVELPQRRERVADAGVLAVEAPTETTRSAELPGSTDAGAMSEEGSDTPETPARRDAGAPPPPPPPPVAPLVFSASHGASLTQNEARATATCSASGPGAHLTITNQRAVAMRLVWVDASCAEVSYGEVAPGTTRAMSTYATHRWRLVSAASGAVVTDFTLDTAGSFAVTLR